MKVTTKEIPKRELRGFGGAYGELYPFHAYVTTKEIPKRELRG